MSRIERHQGHVPAPKDASREVVGQADLVSQTVTSVQPMFPSKTRSHSASKTNYPHKPAEKAKSVFNRVMKDKEPSRKH